MPKIDLCLQKLGISCTENLFYSFIVICTLDQSEDVSGSVESRFGIERMCPTGLHGIRKCVIVIWAERKLRIYDMAQGRYRIHLCPVFVRDISGLYVDDLSNSQIVLLLIVFFPVVSIVDG